MRTRPPGPPIVLPRQALPVLACRLLVLCIARSTLRALVAWWLVVPEHDVDRRVTRAPDPSGLRSHQRERQGLLLHGARAGGVRLTPPWAICTSKGIGSMHARLGQRRRLRRDRTRGPIEAAIRIREAVLRRRLAADPPTFSGGVVGSKRDNANRQGNRALMRTDAFRLLEIVAGTLTHVEGCIVDLRRTARRVGQGEQVGGFAVSGRTPKIRVAVRPLDDVDLDRGKADAVANDAHCARLPVPPAWAATPRPPPPPGPVALPAPDGPRPPNAPSRALPRYRRKSARRAC